MYTNINTNHALEAINQWLDDKINHLNQTSIGDLRIWRYLLPTTNWHSYGYLVSMHVCSNILHNSWINLFTNFWMESFFLHRYIDDMFGIWVMNDPSITWNDICKATNSFGLLHWDIKEPTNSLAYLDINITIQYNQIITSTYLKEMNLYQYLPPHSAHLPAVQKGMMYSLMHNYFYWNALTADYHAAVIRLFHHLTTWG